MASSAMEVSTFLLVRVAMSCSSCSDMWKSSALRLLRQWWREMNGAHARIRSHERNHGSVTAGRREQRGWVKQVDGRKNT
jgi:hypothetical protein